MLFTLLPVMNLTPCLLIHQIPAVWCCFLPFLSYGNQLHLWFLWAFYMLYLSLNTRIISSSSGFLLDKIELLEGMGRPLSSQSSGTTLKWWEPWGFLAYEDLTTAFLGNCRSRDANNNVRKFQHWRREETIRKSDNRCIRWSLLAQFYEA